MFKGGVVRAPPQLLLKLRAPTFTLLIILPACLPAFKVTLLAAKGNDGS